MFICHFLFFKGSGYFASRGKIAPCYFAIWRQNSPNGYFATSAKIDLSLILTQTLTLTLMLNLIQTLTLTLNQTLIQTEEKHYFASRGKIATSFFKLSFGFELEFEFGLGLTLGLELGLKFGHSISYSTLTPCKNYCDVCLHFLRGKSRAGFFFDVIIVTW